MPETIPKTKIVTKPKKMTFFPLWKIPKIWPDSTIYIIGGGPSVSKSPLHLIHNKNVIGVNNAYKLGKWVDICWFGDSRWFMWNKKELKNFKGLLVTCQRKLRNADGYDIKSILKGRQAGIDRRPQFVCWNGSSGGSAINLAYHLGAKKIILIGFDMQPINGKYNYHDDYLEKRTAVDPYKKFLIPFPVIAKAARKLGIEILNATPGSKINCFPMVNLEDII